METPGGTVKKTRALLGMATGMALIAVGAPAQAAPPVPAQQTFNIPGGDPSGSCAFPVVIVATGKVKTVTTPTGRTIALSANFTAQATNVNTRKTVQYKINGSFISTTDAAGNVTTKATGRNLLSDPAAGIVVTSGNFTFTFDAQGKLVKGLSGTGQVIDVCADLA
jgi:hypothetical protein